MLKPQAMLRKMLARMGYVVEYSYRYPESTINLVEIGCYAIAAGMGRSLSIVQVGAFDGTHDDPLRRVLSTPLLAKALLVEPQHDAFLKLSDLYGTRPNIVLENVAIAEADGEVLLYAPEGGSPKASLEPGHHRLAFREQMHSVQAHRVRALTMRSLLRKHQFDHIDVLQVDVEGYDYDVVEQVFALGVLPSVINLESRHLARSQRVMLRRRLRDEGYQYADVGVDTFAVRLAALQGCQLEWLTSAI